ncbi:MAG: casein kinase I [Chrysothrix sp. TS-e1954]|nr:MAG: casein kinase I [Chrysothrix sp. TS-e1954]
MSAASSNVVGVHYRVGKKIGEGSFGVIFEGQNLLNNTSVAIKFEPRKAEAPQLRDEYRTYKLLTGSPGIPGVYYFGQEGLHNILVIDLLGPSLEDLFDHCNRRFSIKTTVMIAKQMISRVQTIHEKNLIYRDIKPDNFLIGRPGSKQANVVHVVDFGMAKQYRDSKTKQHIPYRERKALSGTARYMSVNTHMGREQSRRDDLEALGHVFIYFLRGGLPWQGLRAATNKQKYEKIGQRKQETQLDELCDGFPMEFGKFLKYCRQLGFEETPDYDYLRDLLTKALRDSGEVEDGDYDWMRINNGKGWEAAKAYPVGGAGPANQITPTNKALEGSRMPTPKPSQGVDHDRLNAALPQKPNAAWPRPTQTQANRPDGSRRPDPATGVSHENVRRSQQFRATDQSYSSNRALQTDQTEAASKQAGMSQSQPAPRSGLQEATTSTPGDGRKKDPALKRVLKALCCMG